MTRQTLKANYLNTISWFNNTIVDWGSAGTQYFLDGTTKQLYKYHCTLPNAGAITSADGRYNLIYTKLGTKALLLKDGELLREINRSYYCADVYEYPAAFVTIENVTYLIHCPVDYKQLDFENVETGEIITNIPGRKPADVFHSRLEISPDNRLLMTKSWVWHPVDIVQIFNLRDCINNPNLLDNEKLHINADTEICTASFIDDTKLLIGSSDEVYDEGAVLRLLPPKHIAIYDLEKEQILNPVKVNGEFGNLFAINEHFAWDLFKFPKIIDIRTGEIVDQRKSINSGKRNSAISYSLDKQPQIVFNRETKQIAISGKNKIEILTPELL